MTVPGNWHERTGYRLPTEAEWEYACRGGVSASRCCGEGETLLPRYAWFLKNSDNQAQPVGQLKPNNFGIFDALGNVAERCQDEMAPYRADCRCRPVESDPARSRRPCNCRCGRCAGETLATSTRTFAAPAAMPTPSRTSGPSLAFASPAHCLNEMPTTVAYYLKSLNISYVRRVAKNGPW